MSKTQIIIKAVKIHIPEDYFIVSMSRTELLANFWGAFYEHEGKLYWIDEVKRSAAVGV